MVDVYECDPGKLRCRETLQSVCTELVSDLALKVIGEPHWHSFPEPGGVTGMYLLSESHLACHTFPEFGFATFNLYCCRPREAWNWETQLTRLLGAARVSVRQFQRGREQWNHSSADDSNGDHT